MKKYFLALCAVSVLAASNTSVLSQTQLDPKIYDENGFRIDQKLPPPPSLPTPKTPTGPNTPPQPRPPRDVSAFKQGEPASCFEYYTFWNIAVNLLTDKNMYDPWDTVQIRGQITNNNRFPITDLTIRARLVRDIPNPEYLRSEIITIEDFIIVENITLNAGKSFDVNASRILPLNAPKGAYRVFFYAYNNDRFNQAGLSFTNDIVASRLYFDVSGTNPQHVYLDQTRITLNDQAHNVMAFMTRHDKETPIHISIPLVNPSNQAEDMTITYTLYKWDSLRAENIVDTKTETVTVSKKGEIQLTYTADKTDASVYFLNIRADNTGLKKDKSVYDIETQSNIRFAVNGYDFPRINSFGVDVYPIKADQEATLFTCYHNGALRNTIDTVNISTTLYDEKGDMITQTEYNEKIGGSIVAIIKKFIPKKDLVNFKTVTTMTDTQGNTIDQIENEYHCRDLDPTLCPKKSYYIWVWILLGVLGLLALILMMRRKRHTADISAKLIVCIVCILPMLINTDPVEAAVVTAPFGISIGGISPDGGCGKVHAWDLDMQDTVGLMRGTFQKEFNFIKSGVRLSPVSPNIVNIGERFTPSASPTTGDWFAAGMYDDSPPMDGNFYVVDPDYNDPVGIETITLQGCEGEGGGVLLALGRLAVSLPIESGTITLSSSDASVVSCTQIECVANNPGTATITVSFGNVAQVSPGYKLAGTVAGRNGNQWFGKVHVRSDYSGAMHPFSFPSITYTITVPPVANAPHASACSGLTNITASGATLNWTYTDADSDAQTNYQIQVATDAAFTAIVQSVGSTGDTSIANTRSKIITGLLPRTQYYARVKTHNDANTWSTYSACGAGFITLGCAEGQYYCHTDWVCKPAGTPCNPPTCVDNGTCDINESCNCDDCNGEIDRCGLSGTGEQLTCAADIVVPALPPSPPWSQVGACCPAGSVWDGNQSLCALSCNTTQAPSELLVSVDQAYITCLAHTSYPTATHFRYRVTNLASPSSPSLSEITRLGDLVLHPIINTVGHYRVECFYGTAAAVVTTGAPSTCVKYISVRDDEATTQGCNDIYSYQGDTLTTTLESTDPFTGRFQCVSRLPGPAAAVSPFSIRYSTGPHNYLDYDDQYKLGVIHPELNYRVSDSHEYDFSLGNTPVVCSVKVGSGYSTNASCQKTACVGNNCSTPQSFSVIHSDNLTCTNEPDSEYKIGCNPDAPQATKELCGKWFNDRIAELNLPDPIIGNPTEFRINFTFDQLSTPGSPPAALIDCIEYAPGDMPGGFNLYANVICSQTLNNDETYTVFAADTGGGKIQDLQTTSHTVKRDATDPDIFPVPPSRPEFYTTSSTPVVINTSRWLNTPVTARVYCIDKPGEIDGAACACAETMASEPTLWSPGIQDGGIGPDRMYYTRTISSSTNVIGPQVQDTAGNLSNPLPGFSINIDTQAPTVTLAETAIGGSPLKRVTITATDSLSEIWKTSGAPADGTNSAGIIYRTGPKADVDALMFDDDCEVVPTYATISDATTSAVATAVINPFDPTLDVLTYCVQDNAGNVTRWVYPEMTQACFSASNMSTIPTVDTYAAILLTRLASFTLSDNQKYGYAFSQNTADANCFRGILASNITTLITNQLTPRTDRTSLSDDTAWNDNKAFVKGTNTLNSNGYYYYLLPNGVLTIGSSPTGTGPKAVVVEGGDIEITDDIFYTGGSTHSLIIIARKNNQGKGGNIRIRPGVSQIDAILIADGGALINTDPDAPGQRLIINGRLYSYNTRAGSLQAWVTGLTDAPVGQKFVNSVLTGASPLVPYEARSQDLERFRVVNSDGNSQCTLHVNYRSYTASQLPPLLQRPPSFPGGSCGF